MYLINKFLFGWYWYLKIFYKLWKTPNANSRFLLVETFLNERKKKCKRTSFENLQTVTGAFKGALWKSRKCVNQREGIKNAIENSAYILSRYVEGVLCTHDGRRNGKQNSPGAFAATVRASDALVTPQRLAPPRPLIGRPERKALNPDFWLVQIIM